MLLDCGSCVFVSINAISIENRREMEWKRNEEARDVIVYNLENLLELRLLNFYLLFNPLNLRL